MGCAIPSRVHVTAKLYRAGHTQGLSPPGIMTWSTRPRNLRKTWAREARAETTLTLLENMRGLTNPFRKPRCGRLTPEYGPQFARPMSFCVPRGGCVSEPTPTRGTSPQWVSHACSARVGTVNACVWACVFMTKFRRTPCEFRISLHCITWGCSTQRLAAFELIPFSV